jgi:hypothetical protein
MELNELEAQVRQSNPKPLFKTINDEKIKLTDEEYEESIKNLALMFHQQQNPELYFTEGDE